MIYLKLYFVSNKLLTVSLASLLWSIRKSFLGSLSLPVPSWYKTTQLKTHKASSSYSAEDPRSTAWVTKAYVHYQTPGFPLDLFSYLFFLFSGLGLLAKTQNSQPVPEALATGCIPWSAHPENWCMACFHSESTHFIK